MFQNVCAVSGVKLTCCKTRLYLYNKSLIAQYDNISKLNDYACFLSRLEREEIKTLTWSNMLLLLRYIFLTIFVSFWMVENYFPDLKACCTDINLNKSLQALRDNIYYNQKQKMTSTSVYST